MGGANIRFENITVNGNANPTVYHRAMSITGSRTEVTLGNGAVITGKRTSGAASDGGSGIFVGSGAWLKMNEGSAVTGCVGTGEYTSGVHVFATGSTGSLLTITEGAVISDNTSLNYGGGVTVTDFAAAVMNGGAIRGNKLTAPSGGMGGGVFVQVVSTFTMNGGEISGNAAGPNASSGSGGGVYVAGGGSNKFIMSGGTIYGHEAFGNLQNTAGEGGAAIKVIGAAKINGVSLSTTETTITAP
jgi:hypothetical protein